MSKHHYANYLSKEFNVFFLNPASHFDKGNLSIRLEKLHENLTVVHYKNLVPRLNSLPKLIQSLTYKKQAKKIQAHLDIDSFDIIWSFDPLRYWNQRVFKAKKYLYHTVDFHPKAKYESEMILSSDKVVSVAELISASLQPQPKKLKHIGHGADLVGFENYQEVQIPGNNKIKACYTGNFHKHIDYKVLQKLVMEHPEVDFILVGPTNASNLSGNHIIDHSEFDSLKKHPNVYFTGSVPSDQLMSYLSQSDINLVLFKKENEIIHCNPHKLMGYFYSGNVTLSNWIDAHKNTDERIILMEKDQEKIPGHFNKIVQDLASWNADENKALRRAFAIENSYENKISEILSFLNEA